MGSINIGRSRSRGVFNGLFGNPVFEEKVSEQYRAHFRRVMFARPAEVGWLREELRKGHKLFCPGCGFDSETCHARIIEEEINR